MALVLGGPEDEQGRNGSACSWRSAAVTTDGLVLDLWPPESKGGPYSSVGLVARTLSFPGKLEALYQVTAHATQEGLNTTVTTAPSAVPDLSLASTVFGQNTPRDTPSYSLDHSPASYPVTPSEPPPRPASTRVSFYLNSLLMNNHELPNSSALVHPGGGCPCCLASLHLWPPTPTSLWASISTPTMWLSRGGPLLRELAEKERMGAEHLLKMQNCSGWFCSVDRASDVLRPPQGKIGDAMEASIALEGTLTQALWSCRPGSPLCSPQLRDFLQSHFRGEQVKLIKKMGDTCSPPQAAGPRGRAALQRLTLKH
ncbi:LOW QUALITY PROTEIN: hypothetical protein QTO34_007774 [Cnephaeus nilssonii]|uniref:Ferritin light chain n=1 Tax=Cnephaeus nilssonii TaxID=3371016 RepID=A0AA40HIZ3_CNENI|nr:LOW QUALITY PROTEIN: hypothetical protein QTO34_007774 [Eptesicus nilssonii]